MKTKSKTKLKTVQISEEAHDMLIKHCRKNGVKAGYFVSKIITKVLE